PARAVLLAGTSRSARPQNAAPSVGDQISTNECASRQDWFHRIHRSYSLSSTFAAAKRRRSAPRLSRECARPSLSPRAKTQCCCESSQREQSNSDARLGTGQAWETRGSVSESYPGEQGVVWAAVVPSDRPQDPATASTRGARDGDPQPSESTRGRRRVP